MTRDRTAERHHAEQAQMERSRNLVRQTDVLLNDAQVVVGFEVLRVGLYGSLDVADGRCRLSLHGIEQSQITQSLRAVTRLFEILHSKRSTMAKPGCRERAFW